jgi:two-component system response regulator FixJ
MAGALHEFKRTRALGSRIEEDQLVCVIEDDAAQRDALSQLLASVGLNVRAYESGESFLEEAESDRVGCAIIDLRMRGMSGLQLQQRLLDRGSNTPVIMTTAYATVEVAVQAMRSGAFDFLEKPAPSQQLLDAIRNALDHDARRRQRREVIDEFRARLAQLTDREREIAAYMLEGRASKVIAIDLAISEKTVEVHRSRILKKMGAESTLDFLTVSMRVMQPTEEEGRRDLQTLFDAWPELVSVRRRS